MALQCPAGDGKRPAMQTLQHRTGRCISIGIGTNCSNERAVPRRRTPSGRGNGNYAPTSLAESHFPPLAPTYEQAQQRPSASGAAPCMEPRPGLRQDEEGVSKSRRKRSAPRSHPCAIMTHSPLIPVSRSLSSIWFGANGPSAPHCKQLNRTSLRSSVFALY